MKIKEAVNIINSTNTAAATTNHDNLQIYDLLIDNKLNWFITMPIKAISWKDVSFDNQALESVSPADLARVMDVIQRLLDTPVNERFPEKKYRLRWIDSNDGRDDEFIGPETYLGRSEDNGVLYWTTFQKFGAEIFTESELDQLKKDNPRLAPAIDAMKEPVEDKNE